MTEGNALGHDWDAADCKNPKTCKVCGMTEGSALGHNWSEATCTEPKFCTICGYSVGAASHDWVGADCETPKTCKICGETDGVALGHDWKAADCEIAKTCKVCGTIEGEPNGHRWSENYSSDEDNHWLECSVCAESKENAPHTDVDADEKCDDCGYDMPITDDPEDEPIPGTGDVEYMAIVAVMIIAATAVVALILKKKYIV